MKKHAMMYENVGKNIVHCFLCSHHCRLMNGKRGICGVRVNVDGALYTSVYGEVITANAEPIEKRTLNHFMPGSYSYLIATLGCNFRCGFCQNWQASQISKKKLADKLGYAIEPEQIVENAISSGCKSIAYSYTEPTIFFEYAYDIARLAKDAGLNNIFVTNGFMTKETVEAIEPYLDAANVDLKSFNDNFYNVHCGASVRPVLETIKKMKAMNIWVEVTTLIIPGQNDSNEELGNIARFLAGINNDIPWNIAGFKKEYKFINYKETPLTTMLRAVDIGRSAGLKNVHLADVPLVMAS